MDTTALLMHADIQNLSIKQRKVLFALIELFKEKGYPPSIQQLCDYCDVRSTSTIHYHLTLLKDKGLIAWNPAEKRAITIRPDLLDMVNPPEPSLKRAELPMMGTIAAGSPLQTTSDTLETIDLASDICPPGCYVLKVRGESMIEDHIADGDWVIINPRVQVRDGDIAVALVEGETATLKRIYREKSRVRLQPSNSSMEPIYSTDVQVQGKVEAIIRRCH